VAQRGTKAIKAAAGKARRLGERRAVKRTTMGRPSEFPGKDPRPLSLSVRTSTKEKLRAAADRRGRSVSDVVDELTELHADKL
jgi:hypothetical protein